MDRFALKEIKNQNMISELAAIGFDSVYRHKAREKFEYINIKIFSLSLPQLNILKQSALSFGADCAVHLEVLTAEIQESDCILGGSFSKLLKIADKLSLQPFGMKELSLQIKNMLSLKHSGGKIQNKNFDLSKTYIVGVLNLTKNSFSDGGDFFDFESAKNQFLKLINDGADIIDIGAESTKPFSSPVSEDDQLNVLLPILEFAKSQQICTPISVDTRSALVARKCVEAGASLINDVSGLSYDDDMAKTLAELQIPVIIQHSKGNPETMQKDPYYDNLMDEIFLDLREKISLAMDAGILKENIIIDPGIGFGKTKEHNFEILRRYEELYSLGCPVMIGLSRKSLLGLNEESNEVKDVFSLALNSILINKNIDFVRVHNVGLHRKLVDMLQ